MHYHNLYGDHQRALGDPKGKTYAIGDVVALKNHTMSAAGYGLTAKFMARYKGEYKIIGQLSANVYFLKDLRDPNASPITANVRQIILLQRDQGPLVESGSESEGEPQNIRLIEQRQTQYKCASIKAAQAGNTRRALALARRVEDLRLMKFQLDEGAMLLTSGLPPPLSPI